MVKRRGMGRGGDYWGLEVIGDVGGKVCGGVVKDREGWGCRGISYQHV